MNPFQLWWMRLTCEHQYKVIRAHRVIDNFLGMGWVAWTEKCDKCGKIRRGWLPS